MIDKPITGLHAEAHTYLSINMLSRVCLIIDK